jgi:aminoglycoside 3-N-acetyltransferase
VVTKRDIVSGLRSMGVHHGAILLVHSSLSSFGHVEGGAETVVDALLKAVGSQGTVLVPTLTGSEALNAANPPIFDPVSTACWTGRIPEVFRQRPQAVRSLHPTHSVAAIGARAVELTVEHEQSITPCGPDSPYGRLARAGGAILLLGVSHNSNTTFHLVEELVGVPYHIQPGFVPAQVVEHDQARTVHLMLHRYGPARDFGRMEPLFCERGIQRDGQIGNARVRLVDARRMVALTSQALRQDPAILLAHDKSAGEAGL